MTAQPQIPSSETPANVLPESREQRASLESQLLQARKMEAIGQLTAGVAHNFNNLLMVISGNIELALLDASGQTRACLEEARKACERAAHLVNQMILFSHTLDIEVRPLYPWPVVARVVDICRDAFDRSIEIVCKDPGPLPAVLGNADQLQQILMNLCLNARDALEAVPLGQRPRQLKIGLAHQRLDAEAARRHLQAREGEFLCAVVEDNGIGMGEEALNRLFEPFFTTKGVGQGTGLGLATVYASVQQHRGWIEVQSEPGKGTRFAVYLPVSREERSESEIARSNAAPGGQETLLLVDDEDSVRLTLRLMLRRSGYQVLEAGDGLEALEVCAARGREIDLVLLDLSMPRMSGEEVLERLRQQAPGLKVVIYTGLVEVNPLLEEKVQGLLRKPLTRDKLLQAVRRVLDGGGGG
jgi:signal transduction histidine kinase